MARYGKWRVFAQHECLYLVGPCYAGDHIVAAMNMDVCPRCGEPCSLNYRDTWARVVRRRVSDAVWYRPLTWGRWHWEYKHRGFLEDAGYDYRKFMRNAAALREAEEVEAGRMGGDTLGDPVQAAE
ncbi:MAG: hypothetical protein ACYTGD_16425 [Planctomycetota bacterium]